MRLILLLFALTSISIGAISCSAWDLIKPSKGLSVDTSIKTDVVKGSNKIGTKADTAVQTRINGKTRTTTNNAKSIVYRNVYQNTYQKGDSIWYKFLIGLYSFLVGWLLFPSFRQIVFMVKKLIHY